MRETSIKVSPVEAADSWLELARRRERSRELGVEGLMLKRNDAAIRSQARDAQRMPADVRPDIEKDARRADDAIE